MIFLSAQPDDYYFLWQLQLQLFNFSRMGIEKENIHVLIGYEKKRGLALYFEDFIKTNNQANFYCYSDERTSKLYLSSLRPHLITKHYKANKWLEKETIFYHDSDIIFNRLPNMKKLLAGDIWYASNTRNYTGIEYIKNVSGENTFHEMCSLIGVDSQLIAGNDIHAGGAQYVLKNVSILFWEKLESDCEKIFAFLLYKRNSLGYGAPEESIQIWCTDMWCLWWNALLFGKKVATHKELNFSWVYSLTQSHDSNSIIHYTGNGSGKNKKLFCKNNYSNCSPFNDDFRGIDKNTSSYELVEEIIRYKRNKLSERTDLLDTSFLIPLRVDSIERLENIYIIVSYIHQHFRTNIILVEGDDSPKTDPTLFPESVRYLFVKDKNIKFHRTKYINLLIKLANTPYIAIYDVDVIIPFLQIEKAIKEIRNKIYHVVYPYSGGFISVDILMKAMFSKLLNAELFESNKGKLNIGSTRSYGGCVFLSKESYVEAGMENENLKCWGPDDVERRKRMMILDYKIKRIDGNLYHLPHPRLINSSYNDANNRIELITEYLNVCSMTKKDLKEYIETWSWIR